MSYAVKRAELKGPVAANSSDPSVTAQVLDFICLFTHDLRRKQKRWQDGKLKYHSFNKRIMLYDDRGQFVGDSHWQADYDLETGEQLQLDRGGVLVEVSDLVGTKEQDLTEILEKRARDVESRRANASRSMPLQAKQVSSRTHSNAPLLHRSLNSIVPQSGALGKAHVVNVSPYEVRHGVRSVQHGQDPASGGAKRRKVEVSPPSKAGFAQNLFGTRLNLSATPISSFGGSSMSLRDTTDIPSSSPRSEGQEVDEQQVTEQQVKEQQSRERKVIERRTKQSRPELSGTTEGQKQPEMGENPMELSSPRIIESPPRSKQRSRDRLRTAPLLSIPQAKPPSDRFIEVTHPPPKHLLNRRAASPECTVAPMDEEPQSRSTANNFTGSPKSVSARLPSLPTKKNSRQSKNNRLNHVTAPEDLGKNKRSHAPTSNTEEKGIRVVSVVEDLAPEANSEAGTQSPTMKSPGDISPACLKKNVEIESSGESKPSGPRSELRIKPRKRRGLLVMTERLPPRLNTPAKVALDCDVHTKERITAKCSRRTLNTSNTHSEEALSNDTKIMTVQPVLEPGPVKKTAISGKPSKNIASKKTSELRSWNSSDDDGLEGESVKNSRSVIDHQVVSDCEDHESMDVSVSKTEKTIMGPQIKRMGRKSVKSKEIFGFPSEQIAIQAAVVQKSCENDTSEPVPVEDDLRYSDEEEKRDPDPQSKLAQLGINKGKDPIIAEAKEVEEAEQKKTRIVNPATRGRKAAVREDKAGKTPVSPLVLEPTMHVTVPPSKATAISRSATGFDRSSACNLPGFSAANGGPWSRHAYELLGMTRPGGKAK